MSDCVRETLCTRCQHRSVCKWASEFVDLQNRQAIGDLSKTPFVIKLHCTEHRPDGQTVRDVG